MVSGLLLLALLYALQLSEAPQLEVHRQAATSLQNQASSTLERMQALGSSLGQGIAEAESDDLLDMWGEPPPVTGSRPAVEQPAAASQAPSRTAAEPQAPIRSSSNPPPPQPPPPPPPPPPPAEAAGAHALAAGLAPVKACAEGCHTRGNCNEELGRCDCPPLSEGPICDRGVVPKCRTQWGLSLPHPPCQAWTSEESDWRVAASVTTRRADARSSSPAAISTLLPAARPRSRPAATAAEAFAASARSSPAATKRPPAVSVTSAAAEPRRVPAVSRPSSPPALRGDRWG